MPTKFIPPLSERQNRPCESCIGNDDECYLTSCWIRQDNGNDRCKRDYAGHNPIPCGYHLEAHEYRKFMDSLMKERGENGSITD
jgi:hypothetical protein